MFEISVGNLSISGNAEVGNDIRIAANEDGKISIKDIIIKGDAKILNNLDVQVVKNDLVSILSDMDKESQEYINLKRIMDNGENDDKTFRKNLFDHLKNFTEGVAASVVANYIMK